MTLDDTYYRKLSPLAAREQLVTLLQNAHAGERAAANAYWGHAHSLFVTNKGERQEIYQIYLEELHHRTRLRQMLADMGETPRMGREVGMYIVGFTIGFLCLFGGWFVPMYGAGKLESTNVVEYEIAARLAFRAGLPHLVNELLFFAEVEWDHEDFFYRKTISHPLHRYSRLWIRPAPRESIQSSYQKATLVPIQTESTRL